MRSDAIFSKDRNRKYRYILWRIWDETKPTVLFIGLNPSTADETTDDPTIRRCIDFAKSWGYGGIFVANLFAFRSTDPRRLYNEQDPVGSENDSYIKEYSDRSKLTIACWGNHGKFINRSKEVCNLVNSLYCLDINITGEPRHPLYVKRNTTAKPYTR